MKKSYSRSGSSHLGERGSRKKVNHKSFVKILTFLGSETLYVQSFQRKRITLTEIKEYAKVYEFNEALRLIAASGLKTYEYIIVRPDYE